jgi:hypothetical protein
MLGVIRARSNAHCRTICDMVPGCNSFARDLSPAGGSTGRWVVCHLKGLCAALEDTLLDAPNASNAARQKLTRLKGRFISNYKWPCSQETAEFPHPGVRRSLPNSLPVGLASFDCSAAAPSSTHGAFVIPGVFKPFDRVPGYCTAVREPRPPVSAIRWPPAYQAPDRALTRPVGKSRIRLSWRWQGTDLHAPLAGESAAAPNATAGTVHRVYEEVAADVAGRSFNGKEVVLLTSNTDGLPLVINMIANLAQFGHRHALVLADGVATCHKLRAPRPPACVWSSALTEHNDALRRYLPQRMWLLWLQRYITLLRFTQLGYNTLLLDADVVLFRDPYPYFKGVLGNYTCIVLCDVSAG